MLIRNGIYLIYAFMLLWRLQLKLQLFFKFDFILEQTHLQDSQVKVHLWSMKSV